MCWKPPRARVDARAALAHRAADRVLHAGVGRGAAGGGAASAADCSVAGSAAAGGGTGGAAGAGASAGASAEGSGGAFDGAFEQTLVHVTDLLDIKGAVDNPAISGRADLIRGGYEFAGKRFGHVLDPRNGQPVDAALLSVVVLPDATETDALSTALLTLGPAGQEKIHALRERIVHLLMPVGLDRKSVV